MFVLHYRICIHAGVIYHLAKEYGKAKEHYERALEIDPTLNDTNQNLMKLKLKTTLKK